MSLIQEALKRQQQEFDDNADMAAKKVAQTASSKEPAEPKTPNPQKAPPVPPPPPPSHIEQPNLGKPPQKNEYKKPSEKSPGKTMSLANHASVATPKHAMEPEHLKNPKAESGNPWKKLILMLLILFLIITGAVVMVFFAIKKLAGNQIEQAATEYIKEVKAITTNENIYVAPLPDKKEEPKVVELLEKVTKKKQEEPKVVELLEKTTKNSSEKPKVAAPVHVPVKWPPLTITAALAKGDKGQAIINGNFINVGEKINGVTLVKIKGNSVELSYMNEKKNVKVGNTVQ